MCSIHAVRQRFPFYPVILSILSLLMISCRSNGPIAQGYPGPRRSAAETSVVNAWISPAGPVRWYNKSPEDVMYINSVDGRDWRWTVHKRVSILPGQRAFELVIQQPWTKHSTAADELMEDELDYRIHSSLSFSGPPYYSERRWLVTFNVDIGQEYDIVRQALDQPPKVYLKVANGDTKESTASFRAYYYSKKKNEWYLRQNGQ